MKYKPGDRVLVVDPNSLSWVDKIGIVELRIAETDGSYYWVKSQDGYDSAKFHEEELASASSANPRPSKGLAKLREDMDTPPASFQPSIDDTPAQIHFTENGIPSIHAGLLTEETKQRILSELLALLPESKAYGTNIAIKNPTQKYLKEKVGEITGYNACLLEVRTAIKRYVEGKE